MLNALLFLDNRFRLNLSYAAAREGSWQRRQFEPDLQLVGIVNDRVGSSELLQIVEQTVLPGVGV